MYRDLVPSSPWNSTPSFDQRPTPLETPVVRMRPRLPSLSREALSRLPAELAPNVDPEHALTPVIAVFNEATGEMALTPRNTFELVRPFEEQLARQQAEASPHDGRGTVTRSMRLPFDDGSSAGATRPSESHDWVTTADEDRSEYDEMLLQRVGSSLADNSSAGDPEVEAGGLAQSRSSHPSPYRAIPGAVLSPSVENFGAWGHGNHTYQHPEPMLGTHPNPFLSTPPRMPSPRVSPRAAAFGATIERHVSPFITTPTPTLGQGLSTSSRFDALTLSPTPTRREYVEDWASEHNSISRLLPDSNTNLREMRSQEMRSAENDFIQRPRALDMPAALTPTRDHRLHPAAGTRPILPPSPNPPPNPRYARRQPHQRAQIPRSPFADTTRSSSPVTVVNERPTNPRDMRGLREYLKNRDVSSEAGETNTVSAIMRSAGSGAQSSRRSPVQGSNRWTSIDLGDATNALPVLPHTQPLSPVALANQKKISLICLALCTIFPPLWYLYGYGHLDWVVVWWTNGVIPSMRAKDKTWAKALAFIATALVVLVVPLYFGLASIQ